MVQELIWKGIHEIKYFIFYFTIYLTFYNKIKFGDERSNKNNVGYMSDYDQR